MTQQQDKTVPSDEESIGLSNDDMKLKPKRLNKLP